MEWLNRCLLKCYFVEKQFSRNFVLSNTLLEFPVTPLSARKALPWELFAEKQNPRCNLLRCKQNLSMCTHRRNMSSLHIRTTATVPILHIIVKFVMYSVSILNYNW